jgi:hypothetical protein
MSRNTIFFSLIGLAWIGFLAFAFFGLFATGGITVDQHASKARHDPHADFAAGSQGTERRKALIAATRLYVERNHDAPVAMAQGKELAPPEFLNEQLAEHHERFRVRKVDGLDADIYEVTG